LLAPAYAALHLSAAAIALLMPLPPLCRFHGRQLHVTLIAPPPYCRLFSLPHFSERHDDADIAVGAAAASSFAFIPPLITPARRFAHYADFILPFSPLMLPFALPCCRLFLRQAAGDITPP